MSFISSTLPGRILHAYAAPSSEESLIKHLITGINVTGATVFLILLFLPAP